MNAAYVHLAINNFPPVINLLAVLVLLGAMVFRNAAVVRTALLMMVAAALFAIPTYLSGEPTEHLVRHMDGVAATAIHPHEEAGEWALIMLSIEGAAALAVLIAFRRRDLPRWATVGMLVLSLVGTATVFRAASLGGHIRHPEMRMAKP
jgi:uncharacterized membrane protein